jgi:hypothetical protein
MAAVYDCGGEYQMDGQPGTRQLTYLCPMPALFCCAGWQSQGRKAEASCPSLRDGAIVPPSVRPFCV